MAAKFILHQVGLPVCLMNPLPLLMASSIEIKIDQIWTNFASLPHKTLRIVLIWPGSCSRFIRLFHQMDAPSGWRWPEIGHCDRNLLKILPPLPSKQLELVMGELNGLSSCPFRPPSSSLSARCACLCPLKSSEFRGRAACQSRAPNSSAWGARAQLVA